MKKKLGYIVNPIAGIGGKVGLKGSDGTHILRKAIELGAIPESEKKASIALEKLIAIQNEVEIITYPSKMGENKARELGFVTNVIGITDEYQTTPEDTERAAKQMLDLGVDLILFAGGDGTARNIYNVVGDKIPVLGIPTGVKIHSAVYANTPSSAGDLVMKYFSRYPQVILKESEVMDIDENAFREDRVSAHLYGYMKIPYEKTLAQNAKAGSTSDENTSMESIASDIVTNMEKDVLYLIGPGTTTRAIMKMLNLKNTLLGVDVVCNKTLVASDLNEQELLKILENKKAKIVISVIGGQGYVFGRGNQQLSHKVIRKVGVKNIIIVAVENKLLSLEGKPLLIDTGDLEVNEMLCGYAKVVTGLNRKIAYKVRC